MGKQAGSSTIRAPGPRPTPSSAPSTDPAFGAWPLAALRSGQCRFACTPDDAPRDGHRFCGRPSPIGSGNPHGSWCPEHRAVVFGSGTPAEQSAIRDARRLG